MLARVNICSRFSERVQILVGSFEARSFEELFQGVKALEWEKWIGPDDAFPVKGYSINSTLFSTRDCQAVSKKAVVERLKSKYRKEWFDETGPIHQIQFSINKDVVSMLIDTSGNGLHKRGYRLEANEAPIKETLAAAMCELSRIRPYHKLYDPFCGSGTILIEGALMAKNIAPGINRNFSAERFDVIPQNVWKEERERAKSFERDVPDFEAFGYDIDPSSIEIARINASRAGVSDLINLSVADVRNFRPSSEKGTLICNPPYGERMMDISACEALYSEMGKVFERRHGWSYTVISPDEEFENAFGRKADKRRKLYNGMIKCQIYFYFK
jgi:putative N6-adenine-specific DNA methylase